jgi:hypothetical protein
MATCTGGIGGIGDTGIDFIGGPRELDELQE